MNLRSGELRPITLRFLDPELERAFLAESSADLRALRIGFAASVGIWLVLTFALWLSSSPHMADMLRVTIGVIIPAQLIALTVSSRVRSAVALQVVGVTTNITAGFAILYLIGVAELFNRFAAAAIVMNGVFAFMRLRFPMATFATLIVLAGYVGTSLHREGLQSARAVEFLYIVVALLLLGALARVTERAKRSAFFERTRSDALLLNVLPAPIAARLRNETGTLAEAFDEVTVLFSDVVGFTQLSTTMPPTKLVDLLDELFSMFDDLAGKRGLEKIKTIGDAYMIAGGVPEPRQDHATAVVEMALEMQNAVAEFSKKHGIPLQLRIGIHTGPAVAGVIGKRKFAYDLWGDTVNVASRMESHGLAGKVQVSEATWKLVEHAFACEDRGEIDIKGRGPLRAFVVTGRRPRQ